MAIAPSAKVTDEIDHERRLHVVTALRGASGRDISALSCARMREQPVLTTYDCIFDLTAYAGDGDNGDLAAVHQVYKEVGLPSDRQEHSIFVTPDSGWVHWAAAIDHYFPRRKHHVAPTLAQAHMRLDTLRAGEPQPR